MSGRTPSRGAEHLRARNVTVRFGGVTALQDVSVAVVPGRVLSVVGPNGSGKSTLFNAITGVAALESGQVTMGERALDGLPLSQRVRLGVGRTFQTPRFDPDMTLRETVLCGYFPLRRTGFFGALTGLAGRREARGFAERCDALIDSFGLSAIADHHMGELPIGQIRLVDVARAMACEPRYLLLDEPAAGLSTREQQVLADEVRRVARSGVGVLLVEHNFELVCRLADHLVVLERGRQILEGTPDDIRADAGFQRLYLGGASAH